MAVYENICAQSCLFNPSSATFQFIILQITIITRVFFSMPATESVTDLKTTAVLYNYTWMSREHANSKRKPELVPGSLKLELTWIAQVQSQVYISFNDQHFGQKHNNCVHESLPLAIHSIFPKPSLIKDCRTQWKCE